MARIAGVDLPRNKRIEIGLTYIFGIGLPTAQKVLLERVVALGKPTVLVLLNGSALAVNGANEHVDAILEAWYPGQAGGDGLADVLFGDYNPAGRLPVTFYRSLEDLPLFEDYAMKGRTYRYYQGEVLFPFGHGLSYTEFEYSNFQTIGATVRADSSMLVQVDVTNVGDRAGDEVVQLYVSYPDSDVERPNRQLAAFSRIHLIPGETRTVELLLNAADLAYWNAEIDDWVMEKHPIQLEVGASSVDIRMRDRIQVLVESMSSPSNTR